MPAPLENKVVNRIVALAVDSKSIVEIIALTGVSKWTINRRLLCVELYGKPYPPQGKIRRSRALTEHQEQVVIPLP